jgi:hypothetical protein
MDSRKIRNEWVRFKRGWKDFCATFWQIVAGVLMFTFFAIVCVGGPLLGIFLLVQFVKWAWL